MTEQTQVSKEEQIGFHKGSIAVLAKEREEFIKLLQIVEQLMQAHVKALKDLGVDLEAEIRKVQAAMQNQGTKKPGDDIADRLA